MDAKEIKLEEIPKPIGNFILEQGKGFILMGGGYYHYTEVCEILKKYSETSKEREQRLVEALEGLLSITSDSDGVAGYHTNDAIANWGEFEEVENAEQLLGQLQKQEQ